MMIVPEPPLREYSILVGVDKDGRGRVQSHKYSREFLDRWVAVHRRYHGSASNTFWYRINVKEKRRA